MPFDAATLHSYSGDSPPVCSSRLSWCMTHSLEQCVFPGTSLPPRWRQSWSPNAINQSQASELRGAFHLLHFVFALSIVGASARAYIDIVRDICASRGDAGGSLCLFSTGAWLLLFTQEPFEVTSLFIVNSRCELTMHAVFVHFFGCEICMFSLRTDSNSQPRVKMFYETPN